MPQLVHERCANHPSREAAARCPECRRFYCRECVTEHQGRMMCTVCVARLESTARQGSPDAVWIAFAALGILFAWWLFYYLGMNLARIPSTFHNGMPGSGVL